MLAGLRLGRGGGKRGGEGRLRGGGARVLRVFAGLRLIEEKVAKSLKLEEEEKKE